MAATPVDMADMPDYLRALWYGPDKGGKSTAMAGLARLGQICVVSTEGRGWRRKPLQDRGIPVENIKLYHAPNHAAVMDAFWDIHGQLFDDAPIVGVVLDHWTSLEATTLQEARDQRVGKVLNNVAGNNTPEAEAIKAALNPYESDIRDYGVWTNKAKEVWRSYSTLPCHVGTAAHMRTDKGQRVPDLTEKFRNILCGSVNMICGTSAMDMPGGQTAYVGRFRAADGWHGGDDLNITRPMMVNPSFDRLVKALTGDLDLETDPETLAFKAALQG